MAGHTFNRGGGVGVAQLELGLVVFEAAFGVLPILLVMALCAFLTQVGIVLIVLLMAAKAVLRRLFVHLALVAFLAFHFGVLTQERELGLLVVELGNFLPVLLGVAGHAVSA